MTIHQTKKRKPISRRKTNLWSGLQKVKNEMAQLDQLGIINDNVSNYTTSVKVGHLSSVEMLLIFL